MMMRPWLHRKNKEIWEIKKDPKNNCEKLLPSVIFLSF